MHTATTPLRALIVLCLLLASAVVARAQSPADAAVPFLAPPGAPASAFPAPDRPVADIISPIWHSEAERDAANETEHVIRLLGIKPGMRVADIGAGSGYYTARLSRALGPAGSVVAQDVMAKYLAELQQRVRQEKLANVTLGLGEAHDPRLPARSLDAALLIHMYHEVEQPYAFLFNLASALKPGAQVGIVDLDRPTAEHGTPPDLLRCELRAVGYREAGFHNLGPSGYLAVFTLPTQAKEPAAITPCKAQR